MGKQSGDRIQIQGRVTTEVKAGTSQHSLCCQWVTKWRVSSRQFLKPALPSLMEKEPVCGHQESLLESACESQDVCVPVWFPFSSLKDTSCHSCFPLCRLWRPAEQKAFTFSRASSKHSGCWTAFQRAPGLWRPSLAQYRPSSRRSELRRNFQNFHPEPEVWRFVWGFFRNEYLSLKASNIFF